MSTTTPARLAALRARPAMEVATPSALTVRRTRIMRAGSVTAMRTITVSRMGFVGSVVVKSVGVR